MKANQLNFFKTISHSKAHASGISQQCTYKGKQYLNGQNVPIEEQPCLNCTCRRAILQCYLRVCPPIISIEAHKKMQVLAKRASGENCQMVKEPHQCCPTLKCDPITVANEELPNRPDNSSSNFDKSSPIQFITTPPTTRLATSQSDSNTVSAGSDLNGDTSSDTRKLVTIKDENGNGLVLRIQPQQQQTVNSPTNRSVDDGNNNNKSGGNNNRSPSVMIQTPQSSSEFLQQDGNLPKLTVIKGTSGQPDSILLITSNPSTVNNIIHGSENLSSQALNNIFTSHNSNGNQQQQVVGFSDALLNTLLETVYSSVSQLNGLNLQGSCMINGSLYVEGSAVLPEGNAYCQYCYCIRQKIMCIKPKCHLMISGCSPKYSNEYACCPTSYSCSNSDISSTKTNNLLLPGKSKSSSQKLAISSEPQNLSAKLSAAIESMSRISQPPRLERQATGSPAGAGSNNEAISARQVDGSLNPDSLQSAMLNLMNSIGLSMNSNEKQNLLNKTNSSNGSEASSNSPLSFRTLTSDSPVVTSSNATATAATTTTTSSSTSPSSTTTTTTTSSTTPAPTKPASDKDEDSSKNDDDGGEEEEEESEKPQQDKPAKNKKVQNNLPEMDKKVKTNNNSTTENPSSVSDFLEPMNKLGPHMVPVSSPPSCVENGRHYAIGEQIPTLESCKHCFCGLDAFKECHMVKCGLETLPHNCEPVTPEGHCCPIRYKCPPETNNQGNNQKRESSQQRYRSESSSFPDSQQFSQIDISKCSNGESSELCSNKSNSNLNNNNNLYNYTDQSGNSEIENIKGLSEINEPPPVVRTTRIVDDVPTNNWTTSVTTQEQSSGNNSTNGMSLTEELSKFIMQINQNATTNQGTGYSIGSSLNSNSNINNTPPTSVNTHEMMINDQHSRMFDYHSVQAPPTETNGVVGVPSIEPEPILNLMKGGRVLMANGEIVPVDPNMNKLLASTVEYAMKDKNFSNSLEFNQGNHQNSGQRDSRSTNAHKLNEMTTTNADHDRDGRVNNLIELANLSLPLNSHLAQVLPSTSPMPIPEIVISDDYIDENGSSNNTRDIEDNVSNLPHARLLRNNHNIPQNFRNQNPNLNTSSLVFFDDPIGNYNGNNNNTNYNNLRYNNSYHNQNNPDNAYTTLNVNSNQTQPPYASRVELLGRPNVSSSENNENSTPTPPQPTTGTPIGLDADRAPETRGWLKSLSGLVHSFGRRLVPVSNLAELDGAASDGKYRDNSQARQMSVAAETARSKQQFLFDHLMQILGNDEKNLASNSHSFQEPPKGLVMRPLASVVQVEADRDATSRTQANLMNNHNHNNNRPDNQRPRPTLSSPYEPLSSSEVEIVTAAVPSQFLEPELPETTLAKVAETAVQNNKDSFARRSDVGLDVGLGEIPETTPLIAISPKIESKFLASDSKDSQENPMIGLDRSTFNRANKQLAVNKLNPNTLAKSQTKLLTCFDQASNKTYQANENWIPGDDPCKTCTCILGEERCQTLTCPEKPAENCREERRNGECCASYICGTNLISQSNFNQFTSTSTSTTATPMRATAGDISGSNARLVMSSMNNQQSATPRAINLGQMSPTGINNIDLSQQRQMNNGFPQPPAQVRNPNMISNFQQQQVNAGIMKNIPGDINNIRRQQLPQNPFRINDLPNVLPPHLRFRPSLQGNQFAPNNLADANQNNKVLFFNQGQSDQRFPLQNFISRRNDINNNINFRIPLQDALSQIGQQKPATRSSSVMNPTILLPTRRVASPAGFNQPFGEQMAINKNNNNLQPMNSDNNWRPPVIMNDKNINQVNNGGNLPSNILIPRMSGEQQQSSLGGGVENNLTGAEPATWQPSSFMMPNNLSQTQTQNHNQHRQQPPQQQPAQPVTSARPAATDMTLTENSASTNEIGDRDRVHFQASPGNQLFSQSSPVVPSADSGFRPIVPIMTGIQRSTTIGQNNLQTQEAGTTSKQSEFTDSTTTKQPTLDNRQSHGETTMPISVNYQQQHELSSTQAPNKNETQTLSSSTEYPSSSTSTSSNAATSIVNPPLDEMSGQSKEIDRSQQSVTESTTTTTTNLPSSSLATSPPSTTTTTTTITTQPTITTTSTNAESTVSRLEIDELSSKAPQPTEPTSSDQSNGFDPMSMFRVSECNIYGRIYPVGQVIKELSDTCKVCTCTSMGVECQNKCR